VQPIRAELAAALQEHIGTKTPAARLFNMPNKYRMLDAFKADLAAAGIPNCDESGRFADFHAATRHSFVSHLASAGVHPKTAQTLARHSTITLTMDRYTYTLRGAEAAALASLPDYDTPETAAAARTGTDDVPVDGDGDARNTPATASEPAMLKLSTNNNRENRMEMGVNPGARGQNQCQHEATVDKQQWTNHPWSTIMTNLREMQGFLPFLVSLAGVAEWQTRWTQNPLSARACGFDSLLRQ